MVMAPKKKPKSSSKRSKKWRRKRSSLRGLGRECLTHKQVLFCNYYAASLNGAQAAVEAGYSEKGAERAAYRLCRNPGVFARIEARLKERLDAASLNAEDAWRRIKELAFSRLTDVASWTEDAVKLIPSEKMSPEVKAGVASVMLKPGEYGTTLSLRMRDPLPALLKIVEACEKAKQPEEREDGRKDLGTILYFPAGAHVRADVDADPTGGNETNDGAGDE